MFEAVMTMLSGTRLLRTSRGHAGFRLFLDPSQVVDVDGAQGRDRTTDTAIFSLWRFAFVSLLDIAALEN